jgi:putative peptidoglycan lipid II flippase
MSNSDSQINKNQGIQDLKTNLKIKQSVTKAAGLMSLGTLVSRILGFFRDRLIVQFFDVQVADAFYAAFRLPNFFRILLGEGALSVSFLPAYIDLQRRNDKSEEILAGTVWMFLSVMSATISAFAVLYMTELLPYIVDVDQFLLVPNKYEMTLLFSKIMFSYLFLVSQFAFFMSILNSHDEFFYPGLAPAVFNFLVILVMIVQPNFLGVVGDSLPLSVMVGGVGQALLVIFKSYQLKIIPKPNFLFFKPEFLKVLRRAAPSMIGIGAIQFLGVLNLGFASSLDPGSITFLYLADRLLELPQSILAISLGAALLPRLTSHWSHDDKEGFLNQIYETTTMYYFLAIPSAIGLVMLAEPMVTLLFATKNLTAENIKTTASLVQIYSIMLIVGGTSRLILQGFYAVKNTFYPAIGSCLIIGIHYFLAPELMKIWGLMGLVISTTSSSLMALLLTFICFQILVTPMNLMQFFKPIPGLILLNLPTALISFFTLMIWQHETHLSLKNIYLSVGILLSVVSYFFFAKVFKFEQVNVFLKIFRRR